MEGKIIRTFGEPGGIYLVVVYHGDSFIVHNEDGDELKVCATENEAFQFAAEMSGDDEGQL